MVAPSRSLSAMASMYLPSHRCAGTLTFYAENGNGVSVTFDETGEATAVLLETLAAAVRAEGEGIVVEPTTLARVLPELN